MRRTLLSPSLALSLLLSVGLLGLGGTAAAEYQKPAIPSHPDKIVFKPFTYVPPSAKDYRVVLPTSHVPAYLAVDHELPLVTIQVHVHTGDYMEPPQQAGLAELTGYLMAKGGTAGSTPRTAEALDERLAFLAANLNTSIGETAGLVTLNLLAKDLDEGLAILRDVLSAPRFQEDRLALRKDQILTDMKQRNDDSANIESRELDVLAYGPDHFSNHFDTQASIDGIRRADLVAFHRRFFVPQNFIVTAAGDFDREQMAKKLDALLSSWPYAGQANTTPIPKPTRPMPAGLFLIDKPDVTQGRVSVNLPGVSRDDPDYFAILLMNDILGGGGFTSRITNRVRSDEGLAYHAGSHFTGGVYYPGLFTANLQSKLRTCGYAAAIVIEEMKKIREGGATADELATAKKQMIEVLPRRFATKSQIVGSLANEEFTGRWAKDPEYFQHYRERVEAVKQDDINRVARRLLTTDGVTILVVGKKADLLNPDPRHPVVFASLTGGKFTELPLRDPMTMKPLPLGQGVSAPARPAAPTAGPAPGASPMTAPLLTAPKGAKTR